jgi:hypothetical protein
MSSQQAPLTAFQPVPDGEVTAADWTIDAPRARRCAECDGHIPPAHTARDGSQRCNDCVEPLGVDR